MRFSQIKTLRVYKPASFWWEKRNTVVIFVRRLGKNVVMTKPIKNTVAVLTFFSPQKGSVTSNQNN